MESGPTARRAKRDERTTKEWLQRHKTALLGIVGVLAGAFAVITRASPSMSAAIGEIRLAFALFLMDIGERAAPFFQDIADLAWKLLALWEGLPEDLKTALVNGLPGVIDYIKKNWETMLLSLAAKIDETFGTGDTAQTTTKTWIDGFKEGLSRFVPVVKETIDRVWDTMKQEWRKFRDDPLGWGRDLIIRFAAGIWSTTSQVYSAVSNVLSLIWARFSNYASYSYWWGRNLLGNFVDGLWSKYSYLYRTLSSIWDTVWGFLSFDIPANDRLAFRWGADMVRHFEEGMRSVRFEPSLPIIAPVGGGNSTTYSSTPISVTVNVTGSQAASMNEQKLARLVRDEIGQALRKRT